MSTELFKQTLTEQIQRWKLELTPVQLDTLAGHFEAMIETNRLHNLTRITDPADAASQLYADSLAVWAWLRSIQWEPKTILDVGTGAGFPAFPLAVVLPSTRVIAIDGRGKKIRFLREVAEKLHVGNLEAVHARGEEHKSRARADLTTFKAVGSIADCLQSAKQLTRPGGQAVIFKSTELDPTEESQATAATARMQFAERTRFDYSLENGTTCIRRSLRIYYL